MALKKSVALPIIRGSKKTLRRRKYLPSQYTLAPLHIEKVFAPKVPWADLQWCQIDARHPRILRP